MIEAHTLDSWTRLADRQLPAYRWAIVVAGFGAPLFLFLAGVALVLAAGSRERRGMPPTEAAGAAVRRGLWIFGLAFLFRLQSFLISGGRFPEALLKVDILNVMGVSMMVGGAALFPSPAPLARAVWFCALTASAAMFTPLVRGSTLLAALPDPVEGYLRPVTGYTSFALFPWAGFLTAGCAAGVWLDALRTGDAERRGNLALGSVGCATALLAYAASFLPPIYANSSFWTSSPTFFFIRLGVLLIMLAFACEAARVWQAGPLQELGRASLFVYWIHVELVYGVFSAPIHRRLPFLLALVAYVMFAAAMYWAVRVKTRLSARGRPTEIQPA